MKEYATKKVELDLLDANLTDKATRYMYALNATSNNFTKYHLLDMTTSMFDDEDKLNKWYERVKGLIQESRTDEKSIKDSLKKLDALHKTIIREMHRGNH